MRPQSSSTTKSGTMSQKTASLLALLLGLFVTGSSCWRTYDSSYRAPPRLSAFAARRAADESRPLVRIAAPVGAESQHQPAVAPAASIVMGKFKAPAPEQVSRQRVPAGTNSVHQIMRASYRVAEPQDQPEKIVHGLVVGAGPADLRHRSAAAAAAAATQRQASVQQRTVGAKMQVSDEGLNYPPSKLSADIYGNVAEIVTAPPDAVDNDFLVPQSTRFGGQSRP